MFKGIKHTVKCSKCGELVYCNDYNESEKRRNEMSKCCNEKYEYIGFQPVYESIVNFKVAVENVDEEVAVENIDEEIIDEVIEEKTLSIKIDSETKINDNKPTISVAIDTSLKIEDIVDTTKKMNKGIMISLVKEFVENGDKNKLILLEKHYNETYEGSKRYLGKKTNEKLNQMFS